MADPTNNAILASHKGFATSFADPLDVQAFKHCKAQGLPDKTCFRVGDNAIGCWGDSTAQGTGASCAIPPEDMRAKWGSMAIARHKEILVTANGKQTVCILKDVMPHKAAITNGAVIDLNPDACFHLGLTPPVKIKAEWEWV